MLPSAKSRRLLDLPTGLALIFMSPELCVELLVLPDITVSCILINVCFTRFQHRTIERSILRVIRLPCETRGHVLSATVKGTPDLCSASQYFVRSSLREPTSTHNIDWSNDPSEKSAHPSLPASIHRPACELVSSLSLPVVSPIICCLPATKLDYSASTSSTSCFSAS